ncbi:hypothetical protein F1559_000385 [Cyanidiococcus yangmingshanensis]|uniref:Uncharacterized protein n=1 Tax=Cyanidiococcus yangmingshanensis TaxID=2690220 RepID=A0A7J7ICZ4_9RHOD|nr:hypothetical protein F1559_000385 [Cyanidiococcus yangmingshanensis]
MQTELKPNAEKHRVVCPTMQCDKHPTWLTWCDVIAFLACREYQATLEMPLLRSLRPSFRGRCIRKRILFQNVDVLDTNALVLSPNFDDSSFMDSASRPFHVGAFENVPHSDLGRGSPETPPKTRDGVASSPDRAARCFPPRRK